MSKPSRRRFVIGSITILYLLIGVSSFAQKANDPGAHYRELAATNRGLASDYRNRAQSWRDLADKARARQSDSNSAAMKQILADQIAQDDKEAAQAIAEADRLEQKAREFDQKAQETSGTGEVHGPTLPLGGSEANGGAAPNENPKSATPTTNSENANPLPPPSAPIVADQRATISE
jgi:TPP-dependent pyruvate/acetoin dehydrogenase alpha subunit